MDESELAVGHIFQLKSFDPFFNAQVTSWIPVVKLDFHFPATTDLSVHYCFQSYEEASWLVSAFLLRGDYAVKQYTMLFSVCIFQTLHNIVAM